MTLQEVKVEDFHKLQGILERNIAACSVDDRTSFEYVKASVTLHAAAGGVGIRVDNIDDPHVLLIMSNGKFGVLNEKFTFVNTVYADEGYRRPSVLKKMMDIAELWALAHDSDKVLVSSWVYRGSLDISKALENLGYTRQEIIHVKEVRK